MAKVQYDVAIVGGGPSGLAAAHRLTDMALADNKPIRIAVIEKSRAFGEHILSGAVSNPRGVERIFPDYKENGFPVEGVCDQSRTTIMGANSHWDLPSLVEPPDMKKKGYLILSLSKVCFWMAAQLAEKTKDNTETVVDLYPGFAASEIVYDGDKVIGVRVDDTGNDEQDVCYAGVTLFADKNFLSRDLYTKFNLVDSQQTWAVGVKEVWDVKEDYAGKVWHTIGYPLLDGTFGGGFMYGLADNKLAIGMVAGLDSKNPNLYPPQILQAFKKHPMVQRMLKGGKIQKYGASLIPEAGYYALPREFAVDGALMCGDALGVMDIKGFSGVDKALESGALAAETIYEAYKKGSFAKQELAEFKEKVMSGWIGKELTASRYYRYAFHAHPDLLGKHLPAFVGKMDLAGPYLGGLLTGLSAPGAGLEALAAKRMLEGTADLGDVTLDHDRKAHRDDFDPRPLPEPEDYDPHTLYTTPDIVFHAAPHYHEGNDHIDEFDASVCRSCITRYTEKKKDVPCVADCTANVHEVHEKQGVTSHFMSLENCVQCRTCDIVCPEANLRVNGARHGSGPDFTGL